MDNDFDIGLNNALNACKNTDRWDQIKIFYRDAHKTKDIF